MKKLLCRMLAFLLVCFILTGCSSSQLGLGTGSVQVIDSEDTSINSNKFKPIIKTKESASLKDDFWVLFFDVGQADSALIQCNGHYMLIDGGNKDDSSLLFTVINEYGIKKLDYIIGTHPHEDHVGGIPGALSAASAGIVFSPMKDYDSDYFNDFAKYTNLNSEAMVIPEIGDKYTLGDAKIEIFGLNASKSDLNDTSIIAMITYEDTKFLFTGDATDPSEKVILDSGYDLNATVLKVGHHGSDTSSSEQFINAVSPEYAVISVGSNNDYGHPHEGVLNRLSKSGAKIYRTDKNGDVLISSDGKNIGVTVEKKASEEEIMKPGGYLVKDSVKEDVIKYTDVQQYIGNKNSKKFHYSYCDSVSSMSEKNKVVLQGTREEIINQGYEPCGGCKP